MVTPADEPVVVVLAVLNFIFGGVCGGVSAEEMRRSRLASFLCNVFSA